MKRHLTNLKEDCATHEQQVTKRELVTELDVTRKVDMLSTLFGSAQSRSIESHERERQQINSMGQAIHTLGAHISARGKYSMRVDDKLSACLNGHLHGMPGVATPSSRSLPPPSLEEGIL